MNEEEALANKSEVVDDKDKSESSVDKIPDLQNDSKNGTTENLVTTPTQPCESAGDVES